MYYQARVLSFVISILTIVIKASYNKKIRTVTRRGKIQKAIGQKTSHCGQFSWTRGGLARPLSNRPRVSPSETVPP